MMPKIILTGSHLTPAQAFSQELIKHGFKAVFFSVSGPKFNRHQPIISFFSLIKLPLSLFLAFKTLIQIQPKAVVSFGGYSAFPVCLAAKLLGLPLIIHEQTFQAGLSSKITAFLADRIAISWPSSFKYFPQHKTFLTGNLIRREILELKKTKVSNLKTIYITGGHQGSLAINRAVKPILPQLLSTYKIYHQFGLKQDCSYWPKINHPNYLIKSWFGVKALARILAQKPLVISRSGVNTVTELAYLNLPAILIPLLTAQRNEQLTNARFLESLGLAKILLQADLTPQVLLNEINNFSVSLSGNNQSTFNRQLIKKAAVNLYQLLLSVLR